MEYNHQVALEAARKELEEKNLKVSSDEEQEKQEIEENTVVLSTGELVVFNFNYLTGKTILNLKEEFKRINKNKIVMIDELDDTYCTFVASKISNKSFEEIKALKYKDWAKIKNFVKDYLLGD